MTVSIGPHDLGRRTFIVAEAGNNHEGDIGRAREMVIRAAAAGADAVKFQTIVPERLVAATETARREQLGRFQLSTDQFAELAGLAAENGILFLSTPFDLDSVGVLDPLVPAFKIASGDNDFAALLEAVAATGKPILLSTGLADLAMIVRSKALIERVWARAGTAPGLVLLQCTVSYPALPADANLRALRALASLGCPVGFSDHTLGLDAAVLSVALGAVVIEKHFTLDKAQSAFRDHALSADPDELAELVRRVRLAETLLGDGEKRILPVEAAAAAGVRRGSYAARPLAAGTVISADDIVGLRPCRGVPAAEAATLVGRRLAVAVADGAPIAPELLETEP